MADLELLPIARHEYAEAFQWYAEQSVVAAERFTAEFEAAMAAILRDPDRYPRWDDRYRFYLLDKFPYFIAYRRENELIVVVAVRHTSRDQDVWKGR